jgi:hypothetical protein
MKTIVAISFLFFMSNVLAQTDSLLTLKEDQLVVLLNDLRSATKSEDKEAKNKVFKSLLLETIKCKDAFSYPFSKLTSIGTITSDDKMLRLFNWNIEQDDQTQKYYCYILRFDERKKEYLVSELVDNSFMLPARPDGVLDGKDWYGALYYKIVPFEKGSKDMYTLLGLDVNNSMSNIKLLDVLYFSGNNPKLGSPVFKTNKETLKRVFFEHSKKAYMSLKYEANYNRIIFDHLSPESPSMTGFYSYYVPDLSYDAYVFVKDKWVLQEDVIGVNSKSDGLITLKVQNPKTGKIEEVKVKEKWINPSDPSAANGSYPHTAITPESLLEEKDKSKKSTSTKKKDEKEVEYSPFPFTDFKKKKKRNRTTP